MKNEFDDVLIELREKVRKAPRERVAYAIIKQFFQCEDVSPETREEFENWLIHPDNADGKEWALEQVFKEIFEVSEAKLENVAAN